MADVRPLLSSDELLDRLRGFIAADTGLAGDVIDRVLASEHKFWRQRLDAVRKRAVAGES